MPVVRTQTSKSVNVRLLHCIKVASTHCVVAGLNGEVIGAQIQIVLNTGASATHNRVDAGPVELPALPATAFTACIRHNSLHMPAFATSSKPRRRSWRGTPGGHTLLPVAALQANYRAFELRDWSAAAKGEDPPVAGNASAQHPVAGVESHSKRCPAGDCHASGLATAASSYADCLPSRLPRPAAVAHACLLAGPAQKKTATLQARRIGEEAVLMRTGQRNPRHWTEPVP